MKFVYTEKTVKEMIKTQCFPNMQEEREGALPSREVVGVLLAHNGVKGQNPCVLAMNSRGILLVLTGSFDVSKVINQVFIPFSDMQGIKIKSGMFNNKITIQLQDGTRYVFQILKRRNNRLPNQREHLDYICTILESKNLSNMDNTYYKKHLKKERKSSFIYIITLIICLAMLFSQIPKIQSKNLFIFLCIATAVIHFLLYILASCLFSSDRKFKKAYRSALEQMKQTEDVNVFYQNLSDISEKPKNKEVRNHYYYLLSSLALQREEYEKALEYINFIRPEDDGRMALDVEKQKQLIRDAQNGIKIVEMEKNIDKI